MAIAHTASGEVVQVGPLGTGLSQQKTTALFKSRDLEVIRLVLLAGKSLPPHHVAGDITIHCTEGRIAVSIEGSARELGAGDLLFLAGGVQHDVVAVEDASALVTIALHR